MKTYLKVIIAGAGVLAVGAGAYLFAQVQKIKTGAFKVLTAKNLKLSGNGISITLMTQFTNNSDISATIKDQLYDVYLNNKIVGNINNPSSINVPSKSSTVIPLNVVADFKSLFSEGLASIGNILTNPSAVKIKVKGTLTWKSGIVQSKQPFELEYSVAEISKMAESSKV